ncbi:MAG: D-2-hydroxyacid dehydrogenase [Acidobacteria bacterium]|nr:MAG: D-2-hydroxyacid dehydrogenase [Acidobacteriota bacterium]
MKLVIHPPVEAERLGKIARAASPMEVVNAGYEDDAVREIADAEAFFGKITPRLLAAAPRLRWVQAPTNMRGLFSDVIADQVYGYMICFARNLHRYIRNQVASRWQPAGGESERQDFALGPGVVSAIDRAHGQLAGATLGIVGLGSIGAEIARRAPVFGLRVIAVDPVRTERPEGVEALWGVERLPDMLAASDYVVIAAPHTPATEKLFRRPQLEQMKRTACLVNVGRGAIVDLADLTAALEAGVLAGAALDVFEVEPLPPDHPLWRMENVILTPHVAGFSPEVAGRHLALLLDNVGRFARGEPLRNVVNKEMWF